MMLLYAGVSWTREAEWKERCALDVHGGPIFKLCKASISCTGGGASHTLEEVKGSVGGRALSLVVVEAPQGWRSSSLALAFSGGEDTARSVAESINNS